MTDTTRGKAGRPEPVCLLLPEIRFAHAALTNWPRPGGRRTPPLVFLHGPSGVGKSLLGDVARQRLTIAQPAAPIYQLTAAEYAAELAAAADQKSIGEFQTRYRDADLLILDDVHALERRPETQRQLLALLDELRPRRAQVLVTSRRPPSELNEFLPQLVNRFQGGVLAPIKLPGRASRALLLREFARRQSWSLANDVRHFLADQVAAGPRELLGALRQIAAAAPQPGLLDDVELARRILKAEPARPAAGLVQIAKAVARHFEVPLVGLRSRAREQKLVLPRQYAMLLARELTTNGLEQIGRFFGGRSHSTVLHGCHRLEELLPDRPDLRHHLLQLRVTLGAD